MRLRYPDAANNPLEPQEGSITVLALPLGVYDPDKQLSNQQVAELKETFRTDMLLAAETCAYLAVQAVLQFEEDDQEEALKESGWLTRIGVSLGFIEMPGTMEKDRYAYRAAIHSAGYNDVLAQAIGMPEGEWPFDATPPATFAEALREVQQQRAGRQQERHG